MNISPLTILGPQMLSLLMQYLLLFMDLGSFEVQEGFNCQISYVGSLTCRYKTMKSSHHLEDCNQDTYCLTLQFNKYLIKFSILLNLIGLSFQLFDPLIILENHKKRFIQLSTNILAIALQTLLFVMNIHYKSAEIFLHIFPLILIGFSITGQVASIVKNIQKYY